MSDLRNTIKDFLAAQSTLTLATVAADGLPRAASLFFAADEALNIYWVSGAHSRHSINLRRLGHVALTVHAATWNWLEIAGVQIEGVAQLVTPGAEWQAAWELYIAKFPAVAQEFEADIARSDFYRCVPRWARLLNNARGFGYKEELNF